MYIIFSIIFKIKSKSVSRVLSRTAIYLVHILLYASSYQIKKMTSSLSLLVSVLIQMGFTLVLYVTIKAVSSYLAFSPLPHKISLKAKLCGSPMWRLFSVALSLRLPSLDVIQHHCSVEPGLSSYATFRLCSTRPFNLLYYLFYTNFKE